MKLCDFIDENILFHSVTVILETGDMVGVVKDTSDEEMAKVFPYINRDVVNSNMGADGAAYAYVAGEPIYAGNRSQTPGVYQGHLEDEAAWALDWRARERHASEKQLKFLRKHISVYRQIKKPEWPDDPAGLLSYEASDAMTIILEAIRG